MELSALDQTTVLQRLSRRRNKAAGIVLLTMLAGLLLFPQKIHATDLSREKVQQQLDSAQKLMFADPAGAFAILSSIEYKSSGAPDTVMGKWLSLYGLYYGVTNRMDSAIHYMTRSIRYLEGFPHKTGVVYKNLGIAYRKTGDVARAVEVLNNAIVAYGDMADTTGMGIAYSELGSVHSSINDYEHAVELLVKALDYLKRGKTTKPLYIVTARQKLANTYSNMGDYKFAEDTYRQILPVFKEGGDKPNYLATLISLGENLYLQGRYDSAEVILLECVDIAREVQHKEFEAYTYSALARNFSAKDDRRMAERYHLKAIALMRDIESREMPKTVAHYLEFLRVDGRYGEMLEFVDDSVMQRTLEITDFYTRINVCDNMAIAYEALGNDKDALAAMRMSGMFRDSLNTFTDKQTAMKAQAKYKSELVAAENKVLRQENEILAQELRIKRFRQWMLAFLIASILIIGLIVYRNMRLSSKMDKQSYQLSEERARTLQERLNAERQVAEIKEQVIQQQKQELLAMGVASTNLRDRLDKVINLAGKGDAKAVVSDLEGLKEHYTYWDTLKQRIRELNPEFIDNLKRRYPQLRNSDLEFCALLNSGLSTKELSQLLQITEESVYKRKSRISKKLELDSARGLEEIIFS